MPKQSQPVMSDADLSSSAEQWVPIDMIAIQTVLTGFTAEMTSIEKTAAENKTTTQAIADSVECGEIWQAIVSRQEH